MASREAILEHLPRLRRYARALTWDRFAADDLVQDTVERALGKWGLFRLGTRLDAWLLGIMHNLFVNQYRAAVARGPHFAVEDLAAEPAVPGRQSEALEVADLTAALDRLPSEQREVLLLVTLEELSYRETAAILGLPLGTVMSRLSRGRDRLRQLLDGEARRQPELKVVK